MVPGTISYMPVGTVLCNRANTNSIVGADISLYSIVGAINSYMVRPPHASRHRQCCGRRHLPYQENMVKAITCLWASTVLQVPTSAIPEQDDVTSHVRLTTNSIVGVISSHTGRPPHMPLSIDSVTGAGIYRTE